MPDFTFSGGVRFNPLCVADVTMDPATGDPLTCKNPITGAEISGGGDFEIATINISYGEGVMNFIANIPVIDDTMGVTAVAALRPATTEIQVPMYGGKATLSVDDPSKLAVTGDLELNAGDYLIVVTGDGTISVSA